MLKDSWYKDSKTCTSGARLRHVDGFRSLARASGMQTMPVSSFLHYKLDCGYNFLTRSSFGYESGDESMFKFRRVFILDDTDDRLSPPPSINGSLSSDNSISDSNSDTISEMSIDSSSDRSSIISLDDSLDFVYGKSLAQARHYSTSCYNVWEAVKSQAGASTRSRVCPRECDGSFARALSKFTSGETAELKDVSYKEGAFHRQRKSLTIFNGYNASTSSRATTPINKKCIGLELMREHNGNVVVIREVKAVHGIEN
ncbi:hypothetical protein LSTR_LSTR017414 [Laodelphax striatellus]|uniref:Uncharacterized protein n=1 Tax=Laodelphax striatellus TaxID=195883 RepID=A0A482XP33_LAOST|nr:hypothetical protein LSTR_LSTR017414 [Laodelphax striatellus]